MRLVPIGLGIVILTGCSGQPRITERVIRETCPATPPALVCPGYRPDYYPTQVLDAMHLIEEQRVVIECLRERDTLWETLHQSCGTVE